MSEHWACDQMMCLIPFNGSVYNGVYLGKTDCPTCLFTVQPYMKCIQPAHLISVPIHMYCNHHTHTHTHTYIYIHTCVCMYIYIYIFVKVGGVQKLQTITSKTKSIPTQFLMFTQARAQDNCTLHRTDWYFYTRAIPVVYQTKERRKSQG